MLLDYIRLYTHDYMQSAGATSHQRPRKTPAIFWHRIRQKKKQKRDMNEGSGDETMFLPSQVNRHVRKRVFRFRLEKTIAKLVWYYVIKDWRKKLAGTSFIR
jgi:hypothetical protein